ncbi:class I SAM-dependent methyltransferase [Rhizobium leguminosarum]|nr:class I SAM-dependent methyltransferase [Rhizobium leguminosarum]TAX29049.1 class I SAM-dependent methyltransferase [Rhizobium leguminosarum]TAY16050.1 class I SAM-dependent methyltransferase [Rhizobium leguminosarum]TAZ13373.1 class I SAM-dependent methyltransferase [Rhizobium leguminosarum]
MPVPGFLLPLIRRLPAPMRKGLRIVKGYPKRRSIALAYTLPSVRMAKEWAKKDKEVSNFYYDLTPANRDHLIQLISTITGVDYAVIDGYMSEMETDEELRNHLAQYMKASRYGDDIEIAYGRRLGWYAIARIKKPKVLIETGVDHGVGSCVLASALLRNSSEGFPGRYYGTEIRSEAGALLAGKYATTGRILYGDSIQSLSAFNEPIDMFVNDSDHSGEYEYREYQTISEKLAPEAIILGDNAHVTDSLSRFSRESDRRFVFFSEKPLNHWYPGAGIGISFRP